MITLPEVALLEAGLEGDRSRAGKRALTLFQWEHLDVLASLLGRDTVAPELLRRNLHVAGLNLSSLRGALVRLGNEAVIEITGPCAPCSRMQQALGPGGYNALRGHGGWCARIVQAGPVRLGDSVQRA
jgi:MOSC domain-containing protein YiiM